MDFLISLKFQKLEFLIMIDYIGISGEGTLYLEISRKWLLESGQFLWHVKEI